MKYFILTFLLVLTLIACESAEKGKKQLFSDITSLEQEIGNEARPSPGKLDTLSVLLEKYATAYPQDSAAAGFLSRAAEIARLSGQPEQALKLYDKILEVYAGSPFSAKALFMKGFTLDNDLERLDEARSVYEKFLKEYPEDDFADDADFLLKNLGKTEEEILRSFETEQKAQ